MNSLQLIEKIEYLNVNPDRLENFDDNKNWLDDDEKKEYDELIAAVGPFEQVHSVGGTEGGGEYAERVYFFKDHNIYLKITGYYMSYDGTTWNEDFKAVNPQEKTITVYE